MEPIICLCRWWKPPIFLKGEYQSIVVNAGIPCETRCSQQVHNGFIFEAVYAVCSVTVFLHIIFE